MIIDAHHHVWRYRLGIMPWLDTAEKFAALRRDFLAEELEQLLRANGIDGSVIIQDACSIEDNGGMIDVAKRFNFIKGIVAWVPLEDPRATERYLDEYRAKEPKIKGFRHLILFESDPDWNVRPTVLESLKLVAERGYTWDLTNSNSRHLEHVPTVAEKIPALKQVIDHLGKPVAVEKVWEPWASLMARAATYPNVYVKLSGFVNVATTPVSKATKEQYQPYVDHVLEHFGAERVMMASNWPPSTLAADYQTTWTNTLKLIEELSYTERAEVMGGTAVRFYGL